MDATLLAPAPAPVRASHPPGIPARYFDGRHAQAHAVTIAIASDRVFVTGETVTRDEPVGDVAISEEIDRTPRFLQFPDGALCEITDCTALRDLLARNGLARRRLSRWEQSRPMLLGAIVIIIAAACAYLFGWA